MMNCSLPLLKPVSYISEEWHDSQVIPGARFATVKVSLGGRLNLTKQLGALLQQYEFLRAGGELESNEANLADLLVRRLYLQWGLSALQGLLIDGAEATAELLIERGPEALCDEIVRVVRDGLGLSEEERKNS